MSSMLRVAGIEQESIVDGPGLRFAIFVQGCHHNCPGCHNPQTHAFDAGRFMTVEEIWELFAKDPLVSGITFSGGEPFLQPEGLAWLAKKAHEKGKNVMSYSGFTYEALLDRARSCEHTRRLLAELDYLVDGPYIEALRDLELDFRGSSNQRFLNREEMDALAALHEKGQRLAGAGGPSDSPDSPSSPVSSGA